MSKKERELIEFLQTGSHNWPDAFYVYKNRRKVQRYEARAVLQRKERSWFNRTLMRLHSKGLMQHIMFVWPGVAWHNPGVESAKANLVIEQKVEMFQELRAPQKII